MNNDHVKTDTLKVDNGVGSPAGTTANKHAGVQEVIVTIVGVVVLAALPLVIINGYYQDLIFQVFLWWAAASAWNIVGGYAGQFSLGHAGFFAIGAYTSSLLLTKNDISPWIGMFAGAALAIAAALVLGGLTFRLRGPFFALLTLAFGEVMRILLTDRSSITGGSQGIALPFEDAPAKMLFGSTAPYIWIALALAVCIYLLSRWLELHRPGYQLISLRENERAARSLGVPAIRVRLIALCGSAALTAICGTVYAQYIRYIDPSSVAGLDVSVRVALITILGGSAMAFGPAIGSAVVILLTGYLQGSASASIGGGYLAIYGAILIIIVLLAPSGLLGLARTGYKRLRSRGWGHNANS